jgi:hypothetical protein
VQGEGNTKYDHPHISTIESPKCQEGVVAVGGGRHEVCANMRTGSQKNEK